MAVGADGSGGTPGGGGTPPASGTPVTPATTTGSSGVPASGGQTGNDIPVYLSNITGGPAGFTGAGVLYGDEADTPPLSFSVTVTQLGSTKTVAGCQFTTSSGFTFTGVWLREPTNTPAGDWDYSGNEYDWACVTTPAFTPTGGTTFTSNFAGPASGTTLTGVSTSNEHSNDEWFAANTSTPAGNAQGIYDTSGGVNIWLYYRTAGLALHLGEHDVVQLPGEFQQPGQPLRRHQVDGIDLGPPLSDGAAGRTSTSGDPT